MVNILELLKGQLGNAAMGKVAELIGGNAEETSSAMGSVLPAILGGLISKGSTKEGASGMLDFMKEQKVDGGMFDDLSGFLGNGSKTSALMKIGSMALPFILGGKKAGFMNLIAKATGMGSGLMNLLSGQKSHVKDALPAGFGDMLGFSSQGATERVATETASAGGSSLLKWLIPLLAVLAGAWFLTKDGCAAASTETEDKVSVTAPAENSTTNTTATTTTATAPAASTTSDVKVATEGTTNSGVSLTSTGAADGNLLKLDASGNLQKKLTKQNFSKLSLMTF